MDLGLIRKMIVARKIVSYADLHMHIGLISHNCVKYNGRETDYGVVARNFESMADAFIRQAVLQQAKVTPRSTPVQSSTPVPVGSATSGGVAAAASKSSTTEAAAKTASAPSSSSQTAA